MRRLPISIGLFLLALRLDRKAAARPTAPSANEPGDPRRSRAARRAQCRADRRRAARRPAGARAGARSGERDRRACAPFRARLSRICSGSRAIPSRRRCARSRRGGPRPGLFNLLPAVSLDARAAAGRGRNWPTGPAPGRRRGRCAAPSTWRAAPSSRAAGRRPEPALERWRGRRARLARRPKARRSVV